MRIALIVCLFISAPILACFGVLCSIAYGNRAYLLLEVLAVLALIVHYVLLVRELGESDSEGP